MRQNIDSLLAEKDVEALFLYSESFKEVNMYYLTRFLAPDPFLFLKKIDEEPLLIVNPMEYPRAQKESQIKNVRSYTDYNLLEILKTAPNPNLGGLKFISTVVKKELSVGTKIYVPPNFPTIVADALRKDGSIIMPLFDVIEKARETKETEEIDEIRKVQDTLEKVTAEVIELIANSEAASKGRLVAHIDGKKEPLTVQKMKSVFGHRLIDQGCICDEEIIVACGPKGAVAHYFGAPEDKLKMNQPIILDIYPRSIRKRYCTDMTRTIVKGKASKEVKKMFDVVLEARNASIDAIRAGMNGSEVHNLCCDVFEKAGYATTRGGKQVVKGFTHSLGHGVGLQVHEGPGMSEFYKFPLEEHNVVTVEPGLYDPDIGGVRIEDLVEVTKRGCNNLTRMETTLEI